MKKLIAIFLVLICLLCCFSGCANIQNSQDDLTLILRVPAVPLQWQLDSNVTSAAAFMKIAVNSFIAQYGTAGVKIQIEEFSYAKETESIVGTFDTNRATDILFEGYYNMASYIHMGRVVPLDSIISDELRADISSDFWQRSSIGGKTYMIPYYYNQNFIIGNKALFENCGLQSFIPSDGTIGNWTIDEWELILDTLVEKLPTDCYPMSLYAKNDQGDNHVMNLLRSSEGTVFDAQGNFDFTSDECLAALRMLRNGQQKGWFPSRCDMLEFQDCKNIFSFGKMALLFTNNTEVNSLDCKDTFFVNFPGNGGNGFSTTSLVGFQVFDNNNPTKVQIAKDFVKFVMNNTNVVKYSTCSIPARDSIVDMFHDQIFMIDALEANKSNIIHYINSKMPNWRGIRNVFFEGMAEVLSERMTPEDVAVMLNKQCNDAFEKGKTTSKLHE